MSHNSPLPGPNSSVPPSENFVKEKRGGTHERRQFSVQLQGMRLLALESRCKKLGLSHSDYIKELVDKDLVRSGELPKWWFQRRGIH